MSQRDQIGNDHLRALADHALKAGIILASHDDDTREKVDWVHELGVRISEFPVTLGAARTATDLGMSVLMGAPNVLRGASLTGNLSGREAIRNGCCQLLGSDYAPMTLMHAAFALAADGQLSLADSLAMISTHPAAAIGLHNETGAIRENLAADLVLIDATRGFIPRIVRTWVEGRMVYTAPRHTLITTPNSFHASEPATQPA